MPTTPSPYGFNHSRYKKVPNRVKNGGCTVIALAFLAVPIAALSRLGVAVAQFI